ncbi:hypothetical protein [Acidovorax sp. SUPP3334]|uniref:hypothetical protein n=1 Tax=Acidovorax sp. SUPP3334 TaxID=2920881 RepID=UPI0023DE615E|nr:hypothetical protein [Acidovorax sp. SUPP3334]GKT21704.1 hypothetical protein AVHM3334_05720 [Acidovorax sp. SUPP3334]
MSNDFTTADLQNEAGALAAEIIDRVLRQAEPRRTVVVLEALVMLYRIHVQSLSPHGIGVCAMTLGQLAGEMLQASTATPTGSTAVH